MKWQAMEEMYRKESIGHWSTWSIRSAMGMVNVDELQVIGPKCVLLGMQHFYHVQEGQPLSVVCDLVASLWQTNVFLPGQADYVCLSCHKEV